LEIDLQELKVVTQVETQGRFGYGQVRGVMYFLINVHSAVPLHDADMFCAVDGFALSYDGALVLPSTNRAAGSTVANSVVDTD